LVHLGSFGSLSLYCGRAGDLYRLQGVRGAWNVLGQFVPGQTRQTPPLVAEEKLMKHTPAETLHEVYGDNLCPWCYRADGTHHPSCPEPYGWDSPEFDAYIEGEIATESNRPVPARASSFFVFGYRAEQKRQAVAKRQREHPSP